jgi:glycosyltransferase involved in cell wall biosynthesis
MSEVRQRDPSISVLIPAYNAGGFLDAAVASAYAQTVAPSEVIVINDGSTDDTEERLCRLASTLPPSFIWKSKPNGGGASARNAGVRIATGTYVAFLDHDDTWDPTKIERQLDHFVSVPDLAMSFTGYRYNYDTYRPPTGRAAYPVTVMDHDQWNSAPRAVLEQLLEGHWCVGTMSTVMIKRDALAVLPPFDERLRITSDISMYLEIAARGMKIDYLPEPLVEYRWHGKNISRDVGQVWENACHMYDRFWTDHGSDLPDDLRSRALTWRAHWHLQTAIDAIRHGDTARARRHIVKAARIQPSAIRPGWVRMLGIGSPPAGAWPE